MMLIDIETDLAYMRILLKDTIGVEKYSTDISHCYKAIGTGNKYAFVPCTREGLIVLQPELDTAKCIETMFTLLLVGFLDSNDYLISKDPLHSNPVIKDIFKNLSDKYSMLANDIINKNVQRELLIKYIPDKKVLSITHV